jgi:hypothetical protein
MARRTFRVKGEQAEYRFAEGSLTVHMPGREKDAAYRSAEELRPSPEQLSELAGPYRSEEIAPSEVEGRRRPGRAAIIRGTPLIIQSSAGVPFRR